MDDQVSDKILRDRTNEVIIKLATESRHYKINLLMLSQVVKGGFSKMMRDQTSDFLFGLMS